MLKTRKRPIAWIFFVVGLVPVPAIGYTPTEQIQHTLQQVMNVVSNSASSDQQRKEMLRETLMPRFDWLEMAKQALGRHWISASGRESEFVSTFADFLGNAYIGQIGSYRDEKILFIQESIENNRAQVKTKIVPDKGEPTSVNYRLHRVEGEWKIYDVIVEDISIVVNYRSQFSRILAKGSLDDLLKRLREKELRSRD
ncbi:MAG TPA: ABC transporter substrate-binding protein [Candidatus Binatia bacterium]